MTSSSVVPSGGAPVTVAVKGGSPSGTTPARSNRNRARFRVKFWVVPELAKGVGRLTVNVEELVLCTSLLACAVKLIPAGRA